MERAIGEVFQDGEVTLKVVKSQYKEQINLCHECYYCVNGFDCSKMKCEDENREDGNNVIFIEQP